MLNYFNPVAISLFLYFYFFIVDYFIMSKENFNLNWAFVFKGLKEFVIIHFVLILISFLVESIN